MMLFTTETNGQKEIKEIMILPPNFDINTYKLELTTQPLISFYFLYMTQVSQSFLYIYINKMILFS